MTKKETRTRVYCGPSVRGVARQYTSFTGELPEQMKKNELNPDEFPVESEQCTKKLIHAVNHTPSIPLDAAFLPPLL